MSLSVGRNISALRTQRALAQAQAALSSVFERLSSGQRINRASDDAASLSVASSLNAKARVYSQGIRNLNDGISALQIADSTVESLSLIVVRIRELAEQAANGGFSVSQRQAIDDEAQALGKEYLRIAKSASFNRMHLFDGSLAGGLRLQGGFGVSGSIQSSLGGVMGSGSFNTVASFTAGSGSGEVVSGDFNRDGILDMVAANRAGDNIGVLLGNGDGTFGSVSNYGAGNNPQSLDVGDVNSDGILDIVTGNFDSGDVSVLLGKGDGTFETAISYDLGIGDPIDIALGDVNGDGALDIVTANTSSHTVSVFLGTGNGSFGTARSFGTGPGTDPRAVTLGDVNNDGRLDIVTGDDGSNEVSVLLSNGDGTFGAAQRFATGDMPDSVALGDLNGDGNLDIVAANNGSYNIGVLLGNGDGTFQSVRTYDAGLNPMSVALGDLNGDGVLDVAVGGGINVNVLIGNGDGTFQTASLVGANSDGGLALADLNRDGVLDILTTNFINGKVNVNLGATRDGIGPLVPFSLTTQADALQALAPLDQKIAQLSAQRGIIGAFQSRLTAAVNTLMSTKENTISAQARIMDADIATEAAALTRLQISQQAASAVLAQASLQPNIVLQLLGQ